MLNFLGWSHTWGSIICCIVTRRLLILSLMPSQWQCRWKCAAGWEHWCVIWTGHNKKSMPNPHIMRDNTSRMMIRLPYRHKWSIISRPPNNSFKLVHAVDVSKHPQKVVAPLVHMYICKNFEQSVLVRLLKYLTPDMETIDLHNFSSILLVNLTLPCANTIVVIHRAAIFESM